MCQLFVYSHNVGKQQQSSSFLMYKVLIKCVQNLQKAKKNHQKFTPP